MARERKRHVKGREGMAECAAPATLDLPCPAQHNAPPHPALIELVRLLARQTALADLTDQLAKRR